MRGFFFIAVVVFLASAAPVWAQEEAASAQPLVITADKALEWHRNEKQYIARGKATAQQGPTTIAAETLAADYRETETSDFEIYRLTASGGVTIASEGSTAAGDKAVYDVDSGVAVMTGDHLTMTSPDQTVTARDKFEYQVTEGRLSAIGEARAVRGGDTITADSMSAWFASGADGKRALSRMVAEGHVVIATPNETLTGQRATYEAGTNIAAVTGGVKITRGPNVLEGESADVNLATNVSTIHGSKGADGRVRGVFYPGSGKAKINVTDPVVKDAQQPEAGTVPVPSVPVSPPIVQDRENSGAPPLTPEVLLQTTSQEKEPGGALPPVRRSVFE